MLGLPHLLVTEDEPIPPPEVDVGLLDFIPVTIGILFVAIPLGISLWALLDAANRPRWTWALVGRRQVAWIAAIMFGFISVVGGLLISGYYLTKVRPILAGAEDGNF